MKKVNNSEDKIIQAALKEFSTFGFAGARVDAIAEKAKVNKAMIYYHFKSKEKLYEKLLSDVTANVFKHIEEAAHVEGKPLDVFYAVINRYIQLFKSLDKNIPPILLREIIDGGKYFNKIIVPNLMEPVFALIEPIVREAKKQGSIRDVNPFYTFLQFIGSVVFFNLLKVPVSKSSFNIFVMNEERMDDYYENLLLIFKNGIELKG